MTKAQLLVVETRAHRGLKIASLALALAAAAFIGNYAYNAANTKVQAEIKTAVNQTFVQGTADAGEAMQARNLFNFNPPRR